MWDYWVNSPQALHQITILFSDRGIPDGFRHMHGYGSHTFALINEKNERSWVKFHFVCDQEIKNLTVEEADKLAGTDPDYAGEDLYKAIESGNNPKWTLKIQIMSEEQAKTHRDNPFDVTKVWSKKEYPLIEVGEMELNRNPQNYFDEVEQVGFSPSNLVKGIEASPDKMLQGRLFAYPDAQRYRVGPNYQQLKINRPKDNLYTYQKAGHMNRDDNGDDNYEPNSFGGLTEDASYAEAQLKLSGDVKRYNSHEGNDDYSQAGDLYRLISDGEKDRLTKNIAGTLATVDNKTVETLLGYFSKCDSDYGQRIKKHMSK